MCFDRSKLRGRVAEKFGKRYLFSEAMGLSDKTVAAKLRGESSWQDHEIIKAVELLDIEVDEITTYFYTPKVHS